MTINIKRSNGGASHCHKPPGATLLVVNPFGQRALAYANGSFHMTPLRPIPVKVRRPRTQFIDLHAYLCATSGY